MAKQAATPCLHTQRHSVHRERPRPAFLVRNSSFAACHFAASERARFAVKRRHLVQQRTPRAGSDSFRAASGSCCGVSEPTTRSTALLRVPLAQRPQPPVRRRRRFRSAEVANTWATVLEGRL